MIENGIVKEILPAGLARVKFSSSAKCAGCGACERKDGEVSLDASNEIGAKIGDAVKVEIQGQKVLGAAFSLYIAPLISMIIGYFVGGTVIAFVFLFAYLLAVFIFSRKYYSKNIFPKIISVLQA